MAPKKAGRTKALTSSRKRILVFSGYGSIRIIINAFFLSLGLRKYPLQRDFFSFLAQVRPTEDEHRNRARSFGALVGRKEEKKKDASPWKQKRTHSETFESANSLVQGGDLTVPVSPVFTLYFRIFLFSYVSFRHRLDLESGLLVYQPKTRGLGARCQESSSAAFEAITQTQFRPNDGPQRTEYKLSEPIQRRARVTCHSGGAPNASSRDSFPASDWPTWLVAATAVRRKVKPSIPSTHPAHSQNNN